MRIAAIAALSLSCLLGPTLPSVAASVDQHSASALRQTEAGANAGRLGAGDANILIDVHGACRWIDNASGVDLFVPLNTAVEWDAFVQNAPAGVTRDRCCPSRTMSITASDGQSRAIGLSTGRDRVGSDRSRAVGQHTFNVSREDCTRHCNGTTTCNTNTGPETVRQEFECSDGAWRDGARSVSGGAPYNPPEWQECYTPPPPSPPACNNTTSCEGFNQVTRDCNGAIVAVSSNSAACGYVPPAPSPVHGACGGSGCASGSYSLVDNHTFTS